MTEKIICDECGEQPVLYRMWQVGDVIRYDDVCYSCRPPRSGYSDRQLAKHATEDGLRENTGICLHCNTVYGSTWGTAPDTCNLCDEPLKRYNEVEI